MNAQEPNIRIPVDLTNPGQFFACCGLLELADRLWPGAEGWFEPGGRDFCVTFSGENRGTLLELLFILVGSSPTPVARLERNGLEVPPIIAPLAFSFDGGNTIALTLDFWTKLRMDKGIAKVISNPPWNFWSGQQKSSSIWNGLRAELTKQMRTVDFSASADPLALRVFQGGRFGFDCGPAWNALDVGFSPNEQNMQVESSPMVELLAAVGVQRFRPVMNDDRDGLDYFTWHRPYSPSVAAAATAGAIRDGFTQRFRTPVVSRGQYAALSRAFVPNIGECDERPK
jgi:CRISPR-associated protein Csx14